MRHLFLIGLVVCAPLMRAGNPNYIPRDLGSFGRTNAAVTAINQHGQAVVAVQYIAGGPFQTFVVEGARTTALPLGTHGYGINNRGQVVGDYTVGNSRRAFVWENGVMSILGPLPGGPISGGAMAINERGDIAGYAASNLQSSRAARWDTHGGVTELGPSSSLGLRIDPSFGMAINNGGTVVGYTLNNGWKSLSFAWQDGVYRWLNNPLPDEGELITATGVNNRGDITGYTGDWHCMANQAFVFRNGTQFTLLPIPYAAQPRAINDSGEVAGELALAEYYCQGARRAFVYDGKSLIILPLAGASGSTASAINSRGDVAGQLAWPSGTHAVIWERH